MLQLLPNVKVDEHHASWSLKHLIPESCNSGPPHSGLMAGQTTCVHHWQLVLSYVAVLQLLYLDVGTNNITGTLPTSWSNMTQASTATLAFKHM